jgi:signal peptidase II
MMKRGGIFAVVTALTLVIDQWSKYWARTSLRPDRPPVIPGFWDYQLSMNERGAFGFNIPGGRWAFVVVGVIALGFIIAYLRKPESAKLRVLVPLGLIAGGAVGNIYDRILYGRVTDFIRWHYKTKYWPTFNIADAALVAGVIALILFGPRAKKAKDEGQGGDEHARAAK